jgi:hypothetical protein
MFRTYAPPSAALLLPPPAPTTFFRWHDPQGNLHMSSEKPPAGTAYETVTVDGTLSRMDPPRNPEPQAAPPGTNLDPLKVYTPSGAKELAQNAQNAAELVRDQQRQLQQRMEQSGAVAK